MNGILLSSSRSMVEGLDGGVKGAILLKASLNSFSLIIVLLGFPWYLLEKDLMYLQTLLIGVSGDNEEQNCWKELFFFLANIFDASLPAWRYLLRLSKVGRYLNSLNRFLLFAMMKLHSSSHHKAGVFLLILLPECLEAPAFSKDSCIE